MPPFRRRAQDDLILYSMVRANTTGLQFISDRKRLNVAFSRARRLLVIAGHRETALRSPEVSRPGQTDRVQGRVRNRR